MKKQMALAGLAAGLVAGMACSGVIAGPINSAHVDPDATAVLHADMERVYDSSIGSSLIGLLTSQTNIDEELSARLTGFTVGPGSGVTGLTAFGSIDSAIGSMVPMGLLIYGDEKLIGWDKEFDRVLSETEVGWRRESVGVYQVRSIETEYGDLLRTTYIKDGSGGVVYIISPELETLSAMADRVASGAGDASLMFTQEQIEGAMLLGQVGSVKGLVRDDEPMSLLFKASDAMTMRMYAQDGVVGGEARFSVPDEAKGQQIQHVLQGLIAMAMLGQSQQEDPNKLMPLVSAVRAGYQDGQLRISCEVPVEAAMEAIAELE